MERFSLPLASYPPPLPLPPHGQGFLGAELVGEACRGLHKRCVAASEQLMQSMEVERAIVIRNQCTIIIIIIVMIIMLYNNYYTLYYRDCTIVYLCVDAFIMYTY